MTDILTQHEPLCPEAPSPGGEEAGYQPVPVGTGDCLCIPSAKPIDPGADA